MEEWMHTWCRLDGKDAEEANSWMWATDHTHGMIYLHRPTARMISHITTKSREWWTYAARKTKCRRRCSGKRWSNESVSDALKTVYWMMYSRRWEPTKHRHWWGYLRLGYGTDVKTYTPQDSIETHQCWTWTRSRMLHEHQKSSTGVKKHKYVPAYWSYRWSSSCHSLNYARGIQGPKRLWNLHERWMCGRWKNAVKATYPIPQPEHCKQSRDSAHLVSGNMIGSK